MILTMSIKGLRTQVAVIEIVDFVLLKHVAVDTMFETALVGIIDAVAHFFSTLMKSFRVFFFQALEVQVEESLGEMQVPQVQAPVLELGNFPTLKLKDNRISFRFSNSKLPLMQPNSKNSN